jgi:hypothetical protein
MTLRSLLAVVVGFFAFSSRAEVAFLESSSELDDGKAASSMWNAVDGNGNNAWCAKKDDQTPYLSFGFEESVTVTQIGLVVGALTKDGALDKSKKRARVIVIGDTEHRVEANFKDDAAPQTLEITPPVKGKRIVVDFTKFFDGATPDAPLCITELSLKNKGTDLTGASLAAKVHALNASEKKLLHRWLDDVSATTRTLTLSVDGTFSFIFEPLMEGKPAKVRGKWRAGASSITFTIGDKSWLMGSRVTKVDEADGATVELTLTGDAPTPSMAATYRPAPAKLP